MANTPGTTFEGLFDFLSRTEGAGSSNVAPPNNGSGSGIVIPEEFGITNAGTQPSPGIDGDNVQAQIEGTVGAGIPDDELVDAKGNKFNVSNVLEAIANALAIYASNDPGQTFTTLVGQKLRDQQIASELAQSSKEFEASQELERDRLTQIKETSEATEANKKAIAELRVEGAKDIAESEIEGRAAQTKRRLTVQKEIVEIQELGATTRNREGILAQFKITDARVAGEISRTRAAGEENRESLRVQGEITEELRTKETIVQLNREFVTLGMDPSAASRVSNAIANDDLGSMDFTDAQLMEAFLGFQNARDANDLRELHKAFLQGQFLIPDIEEIQNPETGRIEYQQRRNINGETQFRQATIAEKQALLDGMDINTVGRPAAKMRSVEKLVDENGEVRTKADGTIMDLIPNTSSGLMTEKQIRQLDTNDMEQLMDGMFEGELAPTIGSALTELQKLKKNGLSAKAFDRGIDILREEVATNALIASQAFDNDDITLEDLEDQFWEDALFVARVYWTKLEKIDKYLPNFWPGQAFAFGVRQSAKRKADKDLSN